MKKKRKDQNLIFLFKTKKGNEFLNLILVFLVLFALAVLGVITHNIFTDLNSDIQSDPDISPNAKAHVQNLQTNYPTWMDNAFLFILGLLWLFLIISAFMIDSHPAFFIITLILMIFGFVLLMMFANTFEEFSQEDEFAGYQNNFPIMYFVMDNLLMFGLAMGFSVLVVLYGKNKFVGV